MGLAGEASLLVKIDHRVAFRLAFRLVDDAVE